MKFTIRDLLWFLVVVGCVCALVVENRRSARAIHQLKNERNFWAKIAKTVQKAQSITGGRLTYYEDGVITLENAEEKLRTDRDPEVYRRDPDVPVILPTLR
jgi:hypothetical protein